MTTSTMTTSQEVSQAELFQTFGKIGVLSFGGPAGQIALMHRILVDEKKWLDEDRFLKALNYCMLLPGPEAMQLATFTGWQLRGVSGGIIAGLLFVLPGLAVILALSVLYATLGNMPLVSGLLFGLKAAVLAIVAEALMRVSKKGLQTGWMIAVAILSFIAIALLRLPFPLIIAAAAIAGFLFARKEIATAPPLTDTPQQSAHGHVAQTLLIGLAIWFLPLLLIALMLGINSVFTQEGLFFSKTAVVTFGGAYAVLAYVAQQAVNNYGWLKPDEMVTGLGLAETTPGPLILVLVFVGFLGGYRMPGPFDPITGGLLAGLVTTWVTFAPCFLWIFLGAPYVERLRSDGPASAALKGVSAAVVGVIANLAVWFALQVIFGTVTETVIGPVRIWTPDVTTLNLPAVLIALGAGLALFRHVNIFVVLGLAALAGIAARLTGLT